MPPVTLRRLRPLLAVILAAWPGPARAFLGIGDIVFDPNNTAQTINVLHETQQQFDRLGTILGVSTQQFDQLVSLVAAIGNATEAAPFQQSLTPAQLEASVHAVPGLQDASLAALFNPNGQLDAFMGVPLDQWAQAVENPTTAYRTLLVDPAIARLGAAAGLNAPTVAYAQWYAARTPEDQANLGSRAAADFSNLLASDWLQNARQRRVNLQGLAAGGQDASAKAAAAATLSDQQHAQAQLSAGTNAILVESAVQSADANETTVRAIGAQNRLLQDQGDARRNADELRLDAPP
jgi:hypothetical protein